jgi:hypothetical protein
MIAILLILALAVPMPERTSIDPDALFDAAIRHMDENRFADAAQKFSRLAETGHESGALYVNLGRALAETDQLGEARWAIERAARYSSTRDVADRHLSDLLQSLGLPADDTARAGMAIWLWLFGITLMAISLTSLLVWGGLRPVIGIGAALVIGSLVLSFASERHPDGIVVVGISDMFEDSRTLDGRLAQAREGERVRIIGADGARIHVQLADGSRGWIDRLAVREI